MFQRVFAVIHRANVAITGSRPLRCAFNLIPAIEHLTYPDNLWTSK